MPAPTDPDVDPTVPRKDAPPRGGKAKRFPPLAWIILGLLVLFAVIALSQCDGEHVTPGGGQMPMANPGQEQEAVMPATPPPAERPDGQPTPQTRTAPAP